MLPHTSSAEICSHFYLSITSFPCHFSVPLIQLSEGHRRSKEMDGHDADDAKKSTADMTAFVQTLLQQMQSRFQTMSDSIVTKIDEMGNRIDELEQSINDLRTEMGVEGSPSPSVPPSVKEEPKSGNDSA